MKRISGTVNLKEWGFNALDGQDRKVITEAINKTIKKAAGEAIQYIFEDDETSLFFPVMYKPVCEGLGEKAIKNPLMLQLSLPTYSDWEKEEPMLFTFDLREEIKGFIADCNDDGSYSEGLQLLRDALKEIAGEIDRALPKE